MFHKKLFKEVKRVTKDIVDPFDWFEDGWDSLTGVDSLGNPAPAPSQKTIDEREMETVGMRGEITRRNQARLSSTAGAGTNFITQQKDGIQGAGTATLGYDDRLRTLAQQKQDELEEEELLNPEKDPLGLTPPSNSTGRP